MTVQFWGRSPLRVVENHFGSIGVFSVSVCLQLGHLAVSSIMKSTVPPLPVTFWRIQELTGGLVITPDLAQLCKCDSDFLFPIKP